MSGVRDVLPASHMPHLKKTPDKLPCPGRPQVQVYDQTPALNFTTTGSKTTKSPGKYRYGGSTIFTCNGHAADRPAGRAVSLRWRSRFVNLKLTWLTLSSLSLNSLTCGSTPNAHAHAGTTQDDATTCVDVCCRCARNSHWSALYPDQR